MAVRADPVLAVLHDPPRSTVGPRTGLPVGRIGRIGRIGWIGRIGRIGRIGWIGLVGLVAALALAGCQQVRVRTDFDPEADFSRYQRFAWREPPERDDANPFADNTLLRKQVRIAVEAELAGRGYARVEEGRADFFVTFHVTLQDRIQSRTYGWSGAYGYGVDGPYGGVGYGPGGDIRTFQEGTLIVDLVDSRSDQLVWRGWGTNVVPTADTSKDRIRLAVAKILDQFPPR